MLIHFSLFFFLERETKFGLVYHQDYTHEPKREHIYGTNHNIRYELLFCVCELCVTRLYVGAKGMVNGKEEHISRGECSGKLVQCCNQPAETTRRSLSISCK